jgi:hypothetical protein
MDRHLGRLQTLAADIRAAEERLARVTADDPLVRQLLKLKGIGLVLGRHLGGHSTVVGAAVTRSEPTHLGYRPGRDARIEGWADRGVSQIPSSYS